MRCKTCVTHPELRQSGWPPPKDYKCPVCDTYYYGKTGERTEDFILEEKCKKEQHDKAHAKYLQGNSKDFAKGLQDHLKGLSKPGEGKKVMGGFHRSKNN